MADTHSNLAERSGALVESQKGYDPRVVFFYFVIVLLLTILVGGLVYQQILQTDEHGEREARQNRRRIVTPGPRGEIFDRNGRLLVGNRPLWSAVLYVDELRDEINQETTIIGRNYRNAGLDVPNRSQLLQIARTTVAQRYLDQIDRLLGRTDKIDAADLRSHFSRELLLPYPLIEDLTPAEYARLIERLPVNSPLQIEKSSRRTYPYGASAAHVLGAVRIDRDPDIAGFEGDDLRTFKLSGYVGRDGLEKEFDDQLQGEAGGRIIMVDPYGYGIDRTLAERDPVKGKDLVTSLDIDLQQAAEQALGSDTGAAVALDVSTGEVLALASSPGYDLNLVSPRMSTATFQEMQEKGAWLNRALNGFYPPGSTFKLVVSSAGLRSGILTPESTYVTNGVYMVGNRAFRDAAGEVTGEIPFRLAVEKSVNTFFINYGLKIGADRISAEAKRYGLTERTGIELPYELNSSYVGNDAWKRKRIGEPWRDGDTANLSIGQGFIQVTPLQMADLIASIARGETRTAPHILHDPNRPRQHTEPMGLTPEQYGALLDGMERVVTTGTGRLLMAGGALDGLHVAGKTGTAQKQVLVDGKVRTMEIAWFVCFAPVENPQIAIATVFEGDTPDEAFAGGRYAAPIAQAILKTWWNKQKAAATP